MLVQNKIFFNWKIKYCFTELKKGHLNLSLQQLHFTRFRKIFICQIGYTIAETK